MDCKVVVVAVILAVGVLVLLARTLSPNEPAAYAVAMLLGLLALMVQAIFETPNLLQ
jgi:hypothetical protein